MPIDFSNAWKTGIKIINDAISLLPNLALAIVIFLVFLVLAAAGTSLARRWVVRRKKHQGIALLLAQLVRTGILILGFLIAFSVIAPSFRAGDLIRLLGIGGVAIGLVNKMEFGIRTCLPSLVLIMVARAWISSTLPSMPITLIRSKEGR